MPKLCLIHGCKRKRHSRGLCASCYTTAWRLVQRGSQTWESLVDRGLAEPMDPAVKQRGAFLNALKRADEKKLRIYRPAQ